MDPGTALGVVSLILQVGGFVCDTISEFKNVPKETTSMLEEIQQLNGLLESVERLLKKSLEQTPKKHSNFVRQRNLKALLSKQKALDVHDRQSAILRYRAQLFIVRDELRKEAKTPWEAIFGRVERVLKAKDLRESMKDLNHHCATLCQRASIDAYEEISHMDDGIREILRTLEDWREEEKSRKVLEWISPADATRAHNIAKSKRHASTGLWFLELDRFLDWRNGCEYSIDSTELNRKLVPSILWSYGAPGAGKTVLAATVIEHLKAMFSGDEAVVVAYTYCTRETRIVSHAYNGIPDKVMKIWKQYGFGCSQMPLDEVSDLIVTLLHSEQFRRSFLVLDALDEYQALEEDDETELGAAGKLLDEMERIVNRVGGKCRLFLTSRTDQLAQYPGLHAERILIKADEKDIATYISSTIQNEKFRHADRLRSEPELCEKVVKTLVKKADGQFLYAPLAIVYLHHEASLGAVEDALGTIPKAVKKFYSRTIERIKAQAPQDAKLGLRLLSWTTHAFRPLKLSELQHSFATLESNDSFNSRYIIPVKVMHSACAGLLDFQEGVVRICHSTVLESLREYYGSEPWFSQADQDIAETSMRYLSFKDFETRCGDLDHRFKQFPFLEYAASFFGRHASRALCYGFLLRDKCLTFISAVSVNNPVSSMDEFVSRLYQENKQLWSRDHMSLGAFQAILSRVLHDTSPDRIQVMGYPILHVAVLCGLEQIVEDLVESVDIETRGPKDETALHAASRASHVNIVKLLLGKGADINAVNYSGKTALDMIMLKRFQTTFLRRLNGPGHSRTHRTTEGFSFLLSDSDNGEIRRLIKNKTMIDLEDEIERSNDSEEVAKVLVEHGIRIDSAFSKVTFLQLATIYRRPKLVQAILKRGANPLVGILIGPPLEIAQELGSQKIVDMLRKAIEER